MIHELREYRIQPEAWPVYWKLFNQVCMPIRGEEFGRLRGMWTEMDSRQVRFFHLWEYASLDDRTRLRMALLNKPGWRDSFLAKAAPQIHKQHLRVLNPLRVADDLMAQGDEVHLVRYGCEVGRANEFRQRFEESGVEAHALWGMEFPDPNQVVVLTSMGDVALSADAESCLQCTEVTRLKPLALEIG
ncbi:NIPSNAP family protein [Pseudomonas sp. BN414]|uniref:NIPSNAP family protein n=1 Tax=Pseudomonas sp. BN414 TaxID=2567888 RepID=UPI002453A1C9|nr:NIPSNAP family protein [Pseudomonas sp. BN414]